MTEEVKRKPGRPKGSANKPKGRATVAPKLRRPEPASNEQAARKYLKEFEGDTTLAVYGVDDFTDTLIEEAWKNPAIDIYLSDPNVDVLANYNRKMGGRSFSMYRWDVITSDSFFTAPVNEVIVVAEQHLDYVLNYPHPYLDHMNFVSLKDFQ